MAIVYGANYGRPTLDLNFAKNKSLIDTVTGRNLVTFSRAQANYLTTYVGADGLIKYAGADEPRFDHNPLTGECLGLLLEAAGKNLLLRSTDFSATWDGSTNGSLTLNATTSPDGTVNAALFASDGLDSTFLSKGLFQTFTSIPAGTTVTASVFVKNNNANTIEIGLGSLNNRYANASFNFSTQQFAFSDAGRGSSMSGTYTIFPNGWTRLSFTVTTIDIGISRIVLCPDNGLTTNSVYVYGAQLEEGSFPTSYIPTDGTTVTRSADTASITGTNFSRWYNQSAGSVFVSGSHRASIQITLCNIFDSANSSNRQLLGSDQLYLNGGDVNITMTAVDGASKYAYAINNANSVSLYRNGTLQGTDSSFTLNSANSINIGSFESNRYLGGTIARLTYYPTRLQDYQLQQLTK